MPASGTPGNEGRPIPILSRRASRYPTSICGPAGRIHLSRIWNPRRLTDRRFDFGRSVLSGPPSQPGRAGSRAGRAVGDVSWLPGRFPRRIAPSSDPAARPPLRPDGPRGPPRTDHPKSKLLSVVQLRNLDCGAAPRPLVVCVGLARRRTDAVRPSRGDDGDESFIDH